MSPLASSIQLRCAAGAISCLAFAAAASSATAAPLAATGYEAGVSGGAVIGDVNHDGIDDHATTTAGRITVRLGAKGDPTGGGSFTVDTTGSAPNGRAESGLTPAPAGDVDGDGVDDMIVAGDAGYSYIVYGAAGVASPIKLTTGPRVAAIERGSLTMPAPEGPGPNTGIGDFDGDGIDDFVVNQATGTTNVDGTLGVAIIRGGARLQTLSLKTIQSPRVSLISGYKRCFTTWVYWVFPVQTCTVFTPRVAAAGDVNGDGKADLLVNGISGRSESIVFGRAQASTIPAMTPGGGSVYLSPRLSASTVRYDLGPAGDIDGDGYDDLQVTTGGTSQSDPPKSAILRGKPNFPATLPTTEPLIPFTGGAQSTFVRGPIGDQDGDGRDDLLVDVQLADGKPAALRVAGLPAGATAIDTLARPAIAGNDLPTIPYTSGGDLRVSQAGDLDGDGAPDVIIAAGSRAYRLTHGTITTGPGPGAGPATFDAKVTATMPDGLPIAGTVNTVVDCGPIGDGATVEGQELGTTRAAALQAPAAAGDSCRLDWGALVVPTAKNCSWSLHMTHEGRDLDPANGQFVANAGLNHLATEFVCAGGTRIAEGAVPNFNSVNAWRHFGAAFVADGSATIPSLGGGAAKNLYGSAVWPTPINANNWKYSFTLSMSGGNGAAEGVTMAFLPTANGPVPASSSSPVSGFLGTPLGGLGVGGLGATAIAFDVSPEAGDPLPQFIGVTDSAPSGTTLNWLATAGPGVRLRGPAVKVEIVAKDGLVTVATNGVVRLSRAMTLPTSAYLAFTGSTNAAVYQNQTISAFAMTRP